jgi:hypothetical protein
MRKRTLPSQRDSCIAEGIKQLRERNIIDSRLFDWSQHLNAFRNVAAHPDMSDVSITREDAEDLQAFVYAIIEYIYDLADRYDEFQGASRTACAGQSKIESPICEVRRRHIVPHRLSLPIRVTLWVTLRASSKLHRQINILQRNKIPARGTTKIPQYRRRPASEIPRRPGIAHRRGERGQRALRDPAGQLGCLP